MPNIVVYDPMRYKLFIIFNFTAEKIVLWRGKWFAPDHSASSHFYQQITVKGSVQFINKGGCPWNNLNGLPENGGEPGLE